MKPVRDSLLADPATVPAAARREQPGSKKEGRSSTAFYLAAAGILLSTVFLCLLGIFWGRTESGDPELERTLFELRASRVAVAFLAGAALATGGVIVQGLFRNPLASPSILGTTAGASFGGQLMLVSYQALLLGLVPVWLSRELLVPLGCLLGAWLSMLILLGITRARGDLVELLLAGFLLSSLFLSAGSFLISMSHTSWELGRALVGFTLGGVSGSGPRHVALAMPLVVCGLVATWLWARPLDLLLSGVDEAASLGVDVRSVRRWAIVWMAVLTGAAVAVGGNIGFVGLIVPHAARRWVGVAHRRLVPVCALLGGGFVVGCDLVARLAPGRSELPLGVVTGLIGAPLFLAILLKAGMEERG